MKSRFFRDITPYSSGRARRFKSISTTSKKPKPNRDRFLLTLLFDAEDGGNVLLRNAEPFPD
jgi:hypothetical protein